MRRTPFLRIASRTLNVARVFCSRSRFGCSVPKRTSAFAARWNTASAPCIARSSAAGSRVSPSMRRKRGWAAKVSRKRRCPLEKLSRPATAQPCSSRRSHRVLPMKPAQPVTRTDFIEKRMVTAGFRMLQNVLHIHHVNLQTIVGGGEIYTRSLTRALLGVGASVTLYGHPHNRFWDTMGEVRAEGVRHVPVRDERELLQALPARDALVMVHTKLSEPAARELAARHRLIGFAH